MTTYSREKDSKKPKYPAKSNLNLSKYSSFRKTDTDIQSKVEELEGLNQSLRQRDKVKDDAIAQLSDQRVSLSARLQEIERRQILV
jgi:hypothetical protein